MSNQEHPNLIIYNTDDGKVSVILLAKDGNIWMNQLQLAELFDTSIPNISIHISNILKESELKIIGKIDLDAINQRTRPLKKSKKHCACYTKD